MRESGDKIHLERMLNLTAVRDWCMDLISIHSLSGRHDDARALTEEHMEMLKQIDSRSTLWMHIEKTT
ncbi:hypothetical protein SynA15127_00386 [Synechococcus sp. A15-127]|nr:hypothetical protein SynA15127_00386 [Synechococcus sp. A15-127]